MSDVSIQILTIVNLVFFTVNVIFIQRLITMRNVYVAGLKDLYKLLESQSELANDLTDSLDTIKRNQAVIAQQIGLKVDKHDPENID